MRSTRAASAIERLNERTESREYSMLRTSDERFILTRRVSGQPLEKLNEAMELDDFVRFVNGQGPQKAKRVSKLDVQFEKNMRNKKEQTPPEGGVE
ncbi:hypothetical protein [Herbaspirillum huttiense]|uniref:Uncharacterized protein n=1 Tax=Herbaspirillum huttiense subsp. lycopersici TaxID=3074428 RepID=A0ABU2EIT0_9BURK|nr:hypothetical protein [Herbaspirillum huttiense]MDR9848065.1 hypothetical protein [Herbaspirillum huttiense SE1]